MIILATALFVIGIIAFVYCRITGSKRNVTNENLFDLIRQNLSEKDLDIKETGEKEWTVSKKKT